jgi:hypothetical protein
MIAIVTYDQKFYVEPRGGVQRLHNFQPRE